MSGSSFICAHAPAPEWRPATEACLAQLEAGIARPGVHGEPQEFALGWCYLTDYLAPVAEHILAELHARLPGVTWIGTVGVGILAEGVEYFDVPALALMLAPLPRGTFRMFSGRQPLRGDDGGFAPHTALVHADGSTPDLQELLKELSQRTATGYLFGGLSSARKHGFQIADDLLTGGLSGVAFGAEVAIVSRVTQGCQPIGPEHTITRAENNVVVALDHQPALTCALEDLGLATDLGVEDMARALSSTLVGLRSGAEDLGTTPGRFGPDTLVRHIVGLDPEHRVLAVAEEVESDMQLAFCERNPEAAMADLVRIAQEIRQTLDDGSMRALGAIYISCNGRGGPHFGMPHAEARAIRDVLGDVPLVGFFAGGEIARDRLYGYTGILTVFTTPG